MNIPDELSYEEIINIFKDDKYALRMYDKYSQEACFYRSKVGKKYYIGYAIPYLDNKYFDVRKLTVKERFLVKLLS